MDIDEIKQKKLQELMEGQRAEQEQLALQKQISILEQNIKRYMTKDAYSRYANLKLAHNELAVQVLVFLNQAIEAGKLHQITDDDLKELLSKVQHKTDFNIRRK